MKLVFVIALMLYSASSFAIDSVNRTLPISSEVSIDVGALGCGAGNDANSCFTACGGAAFVAHSSCEAVASANAFAFAFAVSSAVANANAIVFAMCKGLKLTAQETAQVRAEVSASATAAASAYAYASSSSYAAASANACATACSNGTGGAVFDAFGSFGTQCSFEAYAQASFTFSATASSQAFAAVLMRIFANHPQCPKL